MKEVSEFNFFKNESKNAIIELNVAFADQALYKWMLQRGGTFRKLKDTLEPHPYRILVSLSKKTSLELNVKSSHVNRELCKIDYSIAIGIGKNDPSMLPLGRGERQLLEGADYEHSVGAASASNVVYTVNGSEVDKLVEFVSY